jgi:6-phosphogluconolactonase (cycloisomerase 2 family)
VEAWSVHCLHKLRDTADTVIKATDGKWLLCANMVGNNVAVFGIDSRTGRLKSAAEPVEQPSPSCIMLLP